MDAPRPDTTSLGALEAVEVSEELFAPLGGRDDVDLCYQTYGDPDDEPVLLIMGLGGPMIWWDDEWCRRLAAHGFFVVRYDNRDTGRSTRVRNRGRVTRPTLVRAFLGLPVRAPYRMSDLAEDAVALLDHLGLTSAHVVGVSMGGMIAQTLALDHADRVRSLTSIMSTTGRRTVGWQHPSLLPNLITPRGPGLEQYIKGSRQVWRMIGSPGYPKTNEELDAEAVATYERGLSNSGTLRQMVAILTQPDRGRRLHTLAVPALVIHGLADKMVHVSGGRATAAAIPGAELVLVDGMGHDLPRPLFGAFTDAIARTARRSAPRA